LAIFFIVVHEDTLAIGYVSVSEQLFELGAGLMYDPYAIAYTQVPAFAASCAAVMASLHWLLLPNVIVSPVATPPNSMESVLVTVPVTAAEMVTQVVEDGQVDVCFPPVVTLITVVLDGMKLCVPSVTGMPAATLDENELEANCKVVPPLVVLALVLSVATADTALLITTVLPLTDVT
jgi:hypothetical protein